MSEGDQATARLSTERKATVERLEALRRQFDGIVAASADSNADDEHDPEGATIGFERAQLSTLVAQAQGHLAELDESIARLAAGTYGVCERCGERIPTGRLDARPTARICVGCGP